MAYSIVKGLLKTKERVDDLRGRLSDKEIISLLQENPSDGLYYAMKKYDRLVYTVISRILINNPQDVEECVEDTFVNIWRSIDKVDPNTDTFKGLILSAARNLAISRYRKLRKEQTVSINTIDVASNDNVAEMILSEEVTKELQLLMSEMKEPDRSIFFRRYFLFESLDEIADNCGLSYVQVKNKLYRGKKKLRKKLENGGRTYEAI